MSAKTVYDIYVPTGRNSGARVARYSDLDAAVEEVKRMQRQQPARAIRLEVIPPEHQEPPKPDDFEQRLMEALRTPLGNAKERKALNIQVSRAIDQMGRDLVAGEATDSRTLRSTGEMGQAVDEAVLAASWEAERGDTGEPNPYLTLLQKRTDAHHAAVERAAEKALQGGQYGVRVDVYPTRTEARVDPTVPYGHSVEHQHLTDPLEDRT